MSRDTCLTGERPRIGDLRDERNETPVPRRTGDRRLEVDRGVWERDRRGDVRGEVSPVGLGRILEGLEPGSLAPTFALGVSIAPETTWGGVTPSCFLLRSTPRKASSKLPWPIPQWLVAYFSRCS